MNVPCEDFWQLPAPRPLDHPLAPRLGKGALVVPLAGPWVAALGTMVIARLRHDASWLSSGIVVGLGFGALCLFLLAFVLSGRRKWRRTVQRGATTPARVVECRKWESKGHGYIVKVELSTHEPRVLAATLMGDWDWVADRFPVGSAVLVVAEPDGPPFFALDKKLVPAAAVEDEARLR